MRTNPSDLPSAEDTRRPFLQNVVQLAIGGASAQILGFFVILLLGQRLGAELFGEISFAQAALVYLMLFSDPGLKILGTRRIAQSGATDPFIVPGVWTLRLVLAAAVFLIWSAFLLLLHPDSPRNWLLWGYGLAILPIAYSTEWIHTGYERLRPVAVSRVLRNVLHLVLVFWLIRSPLDWAWAPALFVITYLAASLYLYAVARKAAVIPGLILRRDVSAAVIRSALPLGISAVMIQIYYSLDSIIIGILRTPQELGYYSAAYKIILFLLAIADTFGTVLLPTLSRITAEKDPERLRQTLPEIVNLLLLIGVPLTLGVMILAQETLAFLFGTGYLPGAAAMKILAVTIFAVFGNLPFGVLLLALHREKKYTLAVTAGAAVNLVLNLILIPPFGIVGAAAATLASELLVWATYLFFLRKDMIRIPWLKIYSRLAIPAVLMSCTLIMWHSHVLVKAVAGAAVFLVSARISGAWSIGRLRYLTEILKLENRRSGVLPDRK
jgi:O-antigen/teichoic acid export membrane protein